MDNSMENKEVPVEEIATESASESIAAEAVQPAWETAPEEAMAEQAEPDAAETEAGETEVAEAGEEALEESEAAEATSVEANALEETPEEMKAEEATEEKEEAAVDETTGSEAAEEETAEAETTEEETGVPAEEEKAYAEKVAEIFEALEKLSGNVEQLEKKFDAKIMHTAHEEQIVDKMHAELQRYKEDMYSQLVRPILQDMIEIRDSILRVSGTYANKSKEEQFIPLGTFSGYSYDIEEILCKNNINIYKSKEGEDYTPIRQRVVRKVETKDEALHGKIAVSLSDGYEYMGKPISPEKIAVYVLKK